MKKLLSFMALSILIIGAGSSIASAAKPGAGGATNPTGNDISWPQCGRKLPTNHAFGIVGVNGGTATNTNPCLAQQLTWANRAPGTLSQPKLQLYVNTANPAQESDYNWASWPTSSTANNPHGTCTGEKTNDLACSWQYGWNRALEADQDRFVPAAQAAGISTDAGNYTWWLDVETMNSWQSGSTEALERNTAALEGMTSYFKSRNAKVGLYSTSYQWNVIVGTTVSTSSSLNGLDSWLAGARNATDAKTFCSKPGLTTGSSVTLAQYISKNLDYDYACKA